MQIVMVKYMPRTLSALKEEGFPILQSIFLDPNPSPYYSKGFVYRVIKEGTYFGENAMVIDLLTHPESLGNPRRMSVFTQDHLEDVCIIPDEVIGKTKYVRAMRETIASVKP